MVKRELLGNISSTSLYSLPLDLNVGLGGNVWSWGSLLATLRQYTNDKKPTAKYGKEELVKDPGSLLMSLSI